MAHTVIALFEEYRDAAKAVSDLHKKGFSESEISFLTPESARTLFTEDADEDGLETADASPITVGEGAVMGGITGLLVGAAAALIPGIGPVLAIGPLGMALSTAVGAGVGAVAGPLVDSFIGVGAPREDAEIYAEGLRRGHTVVAVRADEPQVDTIEDIFMQHGAEDIDDLAREWREQAQASRTSNRDHDMDDYLAQPHQLDSQSSRPQEQMPAQEDYIGQGHDVAAAPTGAFANSSTHTATSPAGKEEPVPMTAEERRQADQLNTSGRRVGVYSGSRTDAGQMRHPGGRGATNDRSMPEPYDKSPVTAGYTAEAVNPSSLPTAPNPTETRRDLGQTRERIQHEEAVDAIIDDEETVFNSDLPSNTEDVARRRKSS